MSFVALAGGVGLTTALTGVIGATAASIVAPMLVGGVASAGIGALGSAVTGGDAGKGALWGGISGLLGGGLGGFFGGVPAEAMAAEESANIAASNAGGAASTAANAGISSGTGAVEGMIPTDLAKMGFASAPTGSEFAFSGAAPQLGTAGANVAGAGAMGTFTPGYAGLTPEQFGYTPGAEFQAASGYNVPSAGGGISYPTAPSALSSPEGAAAWQAQAGVNQSGIDQLTARNQALMAGQKAGQPASGLTGFIKDNPLLLPAGMMAVPMLQNMFGPNYSVPQNQPYSGSLSKFKYDPSQYTPTYAVPQVYTPTYADGGMVSGNPDPSLMNSGVDDLDFMGTGAYPMSQQNKTSFYATPSQMPTSAQQARASYEPNTNPLTGEPTAKLAEGGIAGLSRGALLKGDGDGVSDDIPAVIAGKQPARLSEGEFVVPARIVSELGNGSTDAGAKKLYSMMDRIQKHRGKTMGKKNYSVDSKASKALPA